MRRATPDEYFALVVASLVLIIVLIASFMCIQLYDLRKPTPPCDATACGPCAGDPLETFLGAVYSTAPCSSEWIGRRATACGSGRGARSKSRFVGSPCCGLLGVPP